MKKLEVIEIILSVSLISMLIYFHYEGKKNHEEMMGVLKDIKDKK